jgi:hypothetical protein
MLSNYLLLHIVFIIIGCNYLLFYIYIVLKIRKIIITNLNYKLINI